MSSQLVQPFPNPKPGNEVTQSSQAASQTPTHSRRNDEEGELINFATGDHITPTNTSHIIPSRPLKQLNETIKVMSDVPECKCWEIPDPRSNPPSERMTETRPPEKEACPALLTRDMFLELRARGDKRFCDKIINVHYSVTTSKAKGAIRMQASDLATFYHSKALAPRPPRIPDLNLELPAVQDATRPSHKVRHVVSSKAPISETDKPAPCVQRPISTSYFNPNILPESVPGGDNGMSKRPKSNSMKSLDSQHATKGEPSTRGRTIKLFGTIITTAITSSEEEEEEATKFKHRSGKEPVPSYGIGRGEVVKTQGKAVDSHSARVSMEKLLCNEQRIAERNTDVVSEIKMSGSIEEEVEEEKVLSDEAVAKGSEWRPTVPD